MLNVKLCRIEQHETQKRKPSCFHSQLEKASEIQQIDIGNEGSAFVEVLVARGNDDFKVSALGSLKVTPRPVHKPPPPSVISLTPLTHSPTDALHSCSRKVQPLCDRDMRKEPVAKKGGMREEPLAGFASFSNPSPRGRQKRFSWAPSALEPLTVVHKPQTKCNLFLSISVRGAGYTKRLGVHGSIGSAQRHEPESGAHLRSR